MTPENKKKYDEKEKRIRDALALKEPDRVPMMPAPGLYPIYHSGYTVAEIIYDTSLEKAKNAIVNYLTDFDPDSAADLSYAGQGPIMEIIKSKNMRWAGMPGNIIDDNSLNQFIEFPLLHDDEFDEFQTDRTGWEIRKALPRTSELLEPLASLPFTFGDTLDARQIARVFSAPEFRSMIENLWAIDRLSIEQARKSGELSKVIEDMGFPTMRVFGDGLIPFDVYSDFFRGSVLTMEDFFERPEFIEAFIDKAIVETEKKLMTYKGKDEGKLAFVALHKGFDGFMSNEFYGKYYWKHLRRVILTIIESGRIPYIFAEGKYNSRLDFLTDVPPGKVYYHFEEVDMEVAKKKLQGIACISGGFPAALLDWGTTEQVRDEVKRILDICAPGGGFIFDASCGLGKCKRENVETMFETVREYGVY